MYRTGTGSEIIRRIAAPNVGGMMMNAVVLTLIVLSSVYLFWRRS